MIEFSCVYCGRSMQVAEALLHKQVKCPACGHVTVASHRKPGAPLRPDQPLDKEKIAEALHWAVTYSIAVAYTMSLHNALRDVFGRQGQADVAAGP